MVVNAFALQLFMVMSLSPVNVIKKSCCVILFHLSLIVAPRHKSDSWIMLLVGVGEGQKLKYISIKYEFNLISNGENELWKLKEYNYYYPTTVDSCSFY